MKYQTIRFGSLHFAIGTRDFPRDFFRCDSTHFHTICFDLVNCLI